MAREKPSVREWTIEGVYDAEGNLILDIGTQLARLLADLAVTVHRIGGVIGTVADREEVAPEVFETTRVHVRWESFAPARRLPREPKPEPVEIPVNGESVEEPEAEAEDDLGVHEPEPAVAE